MNKIVPEPVWHNFRFLLVEALAQLADLQSMLREARPQFGQKILDRSGYSENLKLRVRDGCLDAIKSKKINKDEVPTFRMIETVAGELDRITRLCRDCVRHTVTNETPKLGKKSNHADLLQHVIDGLAVIDLAIMDNRSASAIKMVKIKSEMDAQQLALLKRLEKRLAKQDNPRPIVADIFMAQRIEEMGNALQDIGNAITSANMGQPLNMDGLRGLRSDLRALNPESKVSELALKTLAQTRSGSAISGIRDPGSDDADSYIAVFKDGKRRKLKEERDKVDMWNARYPGIAPRILGYDKRGDAASLLIEHLPGQTFEHMLLHDDPALLEQGLKQLKKTLRTIWRKSFDPKLVPANFMPQLEKRWDSICDVHDWLLRDHQQMAGVTVPSIKELATACKALERQLKGGHSVLIHGDFNLDNIIFDASTQSIRFIDLHRSQLMDYVQDVSVFMVSNFRLQGLGQGPRRKAHFAAVSMYDFAAKYARKTGDETFQIRLALGLARSFTTSTRFILDKDVASSMIVRARLLMEMALAADFKNPQSFRLPVEEIFID